MTGEDIYRILIEIWAEQNNMEVSDIQFKRKEDKKND